MRKLIVLLFAILTLGAADVSAQTNAAADFDKAGIKQAALDYIEGWYEGNAERMERSLHPELAKRRAFTDPQTGKSSLKQLGAMTLVQATRAGGGTYIPREKRQKEVTILDVF